MNNEHEMTARAYAEYAFDTSTQPLKAWLQRRLKGNQRDAIDNLARRIIVDVRLPRLASLSTYRAHLTSKKYSADDLATFETAWSEMRTQQLGE